MPRVRFTANIQRQIACPESEPPGRTVREVLDAVWMRNPKARGYVLDDQGVVRKHVTIFVDGVPIRDREKLSDAVAADGEIDVMQALSGG